MELYSFLSKRRRHWEMSPAIFGSGTGMQQILTESENKHKDCNMQEKNLGIFSFQEKVSTKDILCGLFCDESGNWDEELVNKFAKRIEILCSDLEWEIKEATEKELVELLGSNEKYDLQEQGVLKSFLSRIDLRVSTFGWETLEAVKETILEIPKDKEVFKKRV